jgi:hypothetical protein
MLIDFLPAIPATPDHTHTILGLGEKTMPYRSAKDLEQRS